MSVNRFMLPVEKKPCKIKRQYVNKMVWFKDMMEDEDFCDELEKSFLGIYNTILEYPNKRQGGAYIWEKYVKTRKLPELKKFISRKFHEYHGTDDEDQPTMVPNRHTKYENTYVDESKAYTYDHSKFKDILDRYRTDPETEPERIKDIIRSYKAKQILEQLPVVSEQDDIPDLVYSDDEMPDLISCDEQPESIKDVVKTALMEFAKETGVTWQTSNDSLQQEIIALKKHINGLSEENRYLERQLSATNQTLVEIRSIIN